MPDVKTLLHRLLDLSEHSLGIGSAAETRQDLIEQTRQLRTDIDALQPGAQVADEDAAQVAKDNPWAGRPLDEVMDAAAGGDEDAQEEYRARKAAAAAATATAAPAPGV